MGNETLCNNVKFFNTVRATMSPSFQDVVPVASAENLANIGTMMLDPMHGNVFNEWLTSILNRIGMVLIRQPKARNKLSRFWKGEMQWGDLIEEIGIDLPDAKTYLDGVQFGDATTDFQGDLSKVPACKPDPFCKEKTKDITHFHRRNREEFYKKTLFRKTLMKAFTGQTGFGVLLQGIIDSMYTANKRDQYLWGKECFSMYINSPVIPLQPGQIHTIDPIIDRTSSTAFIEKMQQMVELLSFNSTNFNPVAQTQYHDADELILLVKAGIKGITNTQTLAAAFNPEKLGMNIAETIVVDDFGSNTWTGTLPSEPGYKTTPGTGVIAMVFPSWFFTVVNNSTEFASLYNPEGRYWNYWLHVWETYWVSYFAPCLIFNQ